MLLVAASKEQKKKQSRQFLVDILTLVAVALGQEFGLKRGLEGFGFWPCFGGPGGFLGPLARSFFFLRNPVGVGFCFARVVVYKSKCRIPSGCMFPPLMGSEAPF